MLPFGNGSLKLKSTPLGGFIGLFLKKIFSFWKCKMKVQNPFSLTVGELIYSTPTEEENREVYDDDFAL